MLYIIEEKSADWIKGKWIKQIAQFILIEGTLSWNDKNNMDIIDPFLQPNTILSFS